MPFRGGNIPLAGEVSGGTIHFELRDHGVAKLIQDLTIRYPGVVARGINKTLFEVRDAEVRMTQKSFDFWSAVTRTFMANKRSFPFDLAKAVPAKDIEAKLYGGTMGASKKSGKLRGIFWQQEMGFTLKPEERERLVLGSSPASYAVPTKNPTAHLRTPRATVIKSQTPGALLANTAKQGGGFSRFKKRRRRKKGVGNLGTHVFVTPNDRAIMEITPTGERRLLYGLYQRPITVQQHLHFFDAANKAVGEHLIPKLLQEWDRQFGRFGTQS